MYRPSSVCAGRAGRVRSVSPVGETGPPFQTRPRFHGDLVSRRTGLPEPGIFGSSGGGCVILQKK